MNFEIGDRVVITEFPYTEDDQLNYNGMTGTVISLPPEGSEDTDFWYEVMLDDLEPDDYKYINPVLVGPLEMMKEKR